MAASPAGIGGARSCETAAQTREWMEAIAAFFGGHRPLLEAHVVNFFKDRLWETVDAEWMECLRREPVEARVPAISTPPRPTLLALRFRGARHTVCQDPPLCPPNRQWRGSPTRTSPSSPSEVEFVAEDEIVEIVPNIRMEALTMICSCLGYVLFLPTAARVHRQPKICQQTTQYPKKDVSRTIGQVRYRNLFSLQGYLHFRVSKNRHNQGCGDIDTGLHDDDIDKGLRDGDIGTELRHRQGAARQPSTGAARGELDP